MCEYRLRSREGWAATKGRGTRHHCPLWNILASKGRVTTVPYGAYNSTVILPSVLSLFSKCLKDNHCVIMLFKRIYVYIKLFGFIENNKKAQ